jgi:hypothetical protein
MAIAITPAIVVVLSADVVTNVHPNLRASAWWATVVRPIKKAAAATMNTFVFIILFSLDRSSIALGWRYLERGQEFLRYA